MDEVGRDVTFGTAQCGIDADKLRTTTNSAIIPCTITVLKLTHTPQ
jgi:hypothetical protein